MGGGGLRILPHKKWHVWRRDNIERVLRDEREHEEQQQTQHAKQQRLEQERRAEQLRVAGDGQAQEHVNLFQAEEAAAATTGKSRGAREKKTDDTLARHGKLPWYAQTEENEPTARQERKRKRELEGADPLRHMRVKQRPLFDTDVTRGSDEKRRRRGVDEEGSDRRRYSGRYDRSSTSPERRLCQARGFEERGSKKRRKHHKKEKKSKMEALLEELRREREEREASERRRADKLMFA